MNKTNKNTIKYYQLLIDAMDVLANLNKTREHLEEDIENARWLWDISLKNVQVEKNTKRKAGNLKIANTQEAKYYRKRAEIEEIKLSIERSEEYIKMLKEEEIERYETNYMNIKPNKWNKLWGFSLWNIKCFED